MLTLTARKEERRYGEAKSTPDVGANAKIFDVEPGFTDKLIERNAKGIYWLHFAVRPKDNRMKIRLMEK